MTEQAKKPNGTMVGPGDLLSIIGEQAVEIRVLRGTVTEVSGRLAEAMKELEGLRNDVKPGEKANGK